MAKNGKRKTETAEEPASPLDTVMIEFDMESDDLYELALQVAAHPVNPGEGFGREERSYAAGMLLLACMTGRSSGQGMSAFVRMPLGGTQMEAMTLRDWLDYNDPMERHFAEMAETYAGNV